MSVRQGVRQGVRQDWRADGYNRSYQRIQTQLPAYWALPESQELVRT